MPCLRRMSGSVAPASDSFSTARICSWVYLVRVMRPHRWTRDNTWTSFRGAPHTHTVDLGLEQIDNTEPELNLTLMWTEQQGTGGASITAQDVATHDGWGRVTGAAYYKNANSLGSATYAFDRDDNVWPYGESRSYDVATTRILSRAGNSYSYDRAGNVDSATAGGIGWKYIYDALERLIAVRQNGVTLARYAYDVLGRRIVKRVYTGPNSAYLRMIYAGSDVTVEADSTGTLILAYTSGLGVDNLVAIHKYTNASDY